LRLLLDTHVWLWSLVEPERLGRRVRQALGADGTEIWVSAISIWELLLLIEKRRVIVDRSPHEWIEAAFASAPFHEAPINRAVAMRSRTVRLPHQDPADRFLAATAEVFELTLVTDDRHLLRGKTYRTLANA